MALLEIKKFGCLTLRRKAQPVESVTEEVRTLVDDMFETMYAAEGIGLAAPQVGVSRRVVVLDVSPGDSEGGAMVLINPELVGGEGEVVGEEGCLSLPGVVGDVSRRARVRVDALDRDGNVVSGVMTDIAARAVQHEVDHLNGVLVTDHFSAIKRNLLRSQLVALKRHGSRQKQGLTYLEAVRSSSAGGGPGEAKAGP